MRMVEDGLGAKIEGLEREMAEMRLEMRELRATMGQMLVLLSQFTTANVASSALVASASVIPGMWENKATTHGSDPTDAEDAAYVRDEQDRGEIKPMMEDMNCGASAPYEDHENEEVDERASGTYDLPVELWMHILGFVARQQRNPEGQVCIFASLSSVLLASRFWRKLGLASVGAYILPPTKPKKLIRRCLPFIFASCPNLKELCLRNCPVVDSMLTDIPEGLASLDCGFTQITDASIEYLPFSLKAIYLSNTAVTDKGVVELPPSIEVLSLQETSITSHQFHRIKHKFPQLKTLYLSALKKLVPTSRLPPSLQKLSLHPGHVPDERKRFMYNDKCLEDIGLLRHLTRLNLFHVNLSNEGMRKLKDLGLVSLQIVGGMFEDEGLAFLPASLVSLRVSRAKGVTDVGLLSISLLPWSD